MGLSRAENAERKGPEVHLYLEGHLNASDPTLQKAIYAANQYATEQLRRGRERHRSPEGMNYPLSWRREEYPRLMLR